jgi:phospholipid/cholesterol/gamma-HCH transport system permease protein
MAAAAAFDFREDDRAPVLALSGDWTVDTIAVREAEVRALAERLKPGAVVDVSALGRFDVAGAYLIDRTFRESPAGDTARIAIRGQHVNAMKLLETARKAYGGALTTPDHPRGFTGFMEQVGRVMAAIGDEIIDTVGFFGETLVVLGRQIIEPRRLRWTSLVNVMESAGFNALPIVMLLSFFIGLVVAYLGARILGDFGASVFTVELVAFSMMREFGVVITAVLLAGRTNSAFTAEIGAMKMRQEIDAMRVMRIDPMDRHAGDDADPHLHGDDGRHLRRHAGVLVGAGCEPGDVLCAHSRSGAVAAFLGGHVQGAGVRAGARRDRVQAGALGWR